MKGQKMTNKSQRLKIVCVRVLDGCSRGIRKNLLINHPYMFYNNYRFLNNVVKRTSDSTVPYDFYSNNITIHAIVGMNGCGKSTIIEVLLRLINNLAFQFIGKQTRPSADDLGYVKGLVAEFYYEKDDDIFVVRQNKKSIEWLDSKGESMINNDKLTLENLFYTLVINYSHYAYNVDNYQHEIYKAFSTNCWLQSLFHKNDGYETPIVLNPFRENGDININTEDELSATRLTSLFIKAQIEKGCFHKKYNLASFDIKLDIKKVERKYKDASRYWKEVGGYLSSDFEQVEKDILECWERIRLIRIIHPQNDNTAISLSRKYLVYKTISIIYKYTVFRDYFNEIVDSVRPSTERLNKIMYLMVERLNLDNSHITLKIRQTILFITLNHYVENSNLESDQILAMIEKHSGGNHNLDIIMDLLPPPIFKTKIKLAYITDKIRHARIELSHLSSGERQQLYSRSSLLYHLVNLDSIKNPDRIKYNNIEIILDEVELYYHPEYQREYVQSLIESISMLQLSSEKQIDICIVTHSPFILSDIPLENILFLEGGRQRVPESSINTFGSNIYDLLKYNFFLKENAFGEFASKKMKLLYDVLRKDDLNNDTKDKAKELVALIGDEFVVKILTDKY